MKRDTMHAIIMVVAALAIITVALIGVSKASGVSPFQTVVESGSMQHGIGSQLGVIDTGDMIILKSKDKVEIQSFVDGYNTGYRTFGCYGNVIIYDRGSTLNPVIHRAILWLDNNGDGTWSAPSLKDYPSELWSCTGGNYYGDLSGTLTLNGMGYSGAINASVNLDRLVSLKSQSGYLTMGDNNSGFDQPSNIAGLDGLISYDKIESVAWIEIPWIGSFNMILNGDKGALDRWVPNTIPSLAAAIFLVIFLMIGISLLFDYKFYERHRKELHEEMNAPAPLFPVEHKQR